jgi:predicted enzyme related to lactoylglutathione lyase
MASAAFEGAKKEPTMADRKPLPGKFVWFELVTKETKKAQAFYGEVLGWKVRPFPMGSTTYEMIYVGETMIGGFAPAKAGRPSHWISYVSVENVDATVKAAAANGGKVVEAPYDIPGVGRTARIADPQGGELCPLTSAQGDPPDTLPPAGSWCWNELHASDPMKAIAFYEKVFGFTHRSLTNPQGTYHILSRGGVDRAGVTEHGAEEPGWLPYVGVDDADATIARAKRLGATICVEPADIPDVGRFGVFRDPTGASLAILKPVPMEKKR